MDVSGQFHAAWLYPGDVAIVTEWELAGLQSQSRRLGGEKNISSLSGIEQFTVVDPAPLSLYRLSYSCSSVFYCFW